VTVRYVPMFFRGKGSEGYTREREARSHEIFSPNMLAKLILGVCTDFSKFEGTGITSRINEEIL